MDHETKLLYGNGGKRGPPAPLSSESDEGEVLDLDEKPPSSPSSSTSSGPIYVRPPGFTNHGKDIKLKKQDTLLKTKKKLKLQPFSSDIAIASRPTRFKPQSSEGESQKHVVNKQLKPKRDPMPMRRRALPQSFWQQPNSPASLPPGSTYTVLPPLWKHEKTNEDLSEVRPVTPPDERDKNSDEKKETKQSRRPLRTPANIDLLFSLFDVIDVEKKSSNIIKRGRPKKVNRTDRNKNLVGDDPFMVQSVESLLPSLSLETGGNQAVTPLAHLSVVSVKDGDNTLSLPSLTIDQNYPALLSEVVKAL